MNRYNPLDNRALWAGEYLLHTETLIEQHAKEMLNQCKARMILESFVPGNMKEVQVGNQRVQLKSCQ